MGPMIFAVLLPIVALALGPLMRWLDLRDAARAPQLEPTLEAVVPSSPQLSLPLPERPAKPRPSRPPALSAHP